MTAPGALHRTTPDSPAWTGLGSRAPTGDASPDGFRNTLRAASREDPTERKDRLTARPLHALTMATELAVNQLASHGPVKQTVADASERQLAPSDGKPLQESQKGPTRNEGPRQEPRQEPHVTPARQDSAKPATDPASSGPSPE